MNTTNTDASKNPPGTTLNPINPQFPEAGGPPTHSNWILILVKENHQDDRDGAIHVGRVAVDNKTPISNVCAGVRKAVREAGYSPELRSEAKIKGRSSPIRIVGVPPSDDEIWTKLSYSERLKLVPGHVFMSMRDFCDVSGIPHSTVITQLYRARANPQNTSQTATVHGFSIVRVEDDSSSD